MTIISKDLTAALNMSPVDILGMENVLRAGPERPWRRRSGDRGRRPIGGDDLVEGAREHPVDEPMLRARGADAEGIVHHRLVTAGYWRAAARRCRASFAMYGIVETAPASSFSGQRVSWFVPS